MADQAPQALPPAASEAIGDDVRCIAPRDPKAA
jgi:hypothetical protein